MNNNATPLLSIYLVNYNYGKYIKESIESVLVQTFIDYELLIIDDGSTDNSKEIIQKYESLPNVYSIYQKNKGLIKTNNIALGLARGKYIMRLDADDFLHENALKEMVDLLESDNELALVFPDYYNTDESGNITNHYKRFDFQEKELLLEKPAHGAVTMIRTQILKEVGGYDEEFNCQDGYDLWLKIFKSYKIKNIPLPLFYYRQHGSNLTKDKRHLYKTRAKMMEKHINKHQVTRLKTCAVIPVRGAEIDSRSNPMVQLGNKMLIQWTIDEALKSNKIDHIIVTTPDKNLIKKLEEIYKDKILLHERPKNQARINSTINETLVDALAFANKREIFPDAILTLYIEYPFRCSRYMDKSINHMGIYEVEAVESVVQDDSIFYRHDGTGLTRFTDDTFLRLERDDVFRRSGGLHLIKTELLSKKEDFFKAKTGHIMLDEYASFQIKSQLDLKLANFIQKEI